MRSRKEKNQEVAQLAEALSMEHGLAFSIVQLEALTEEDRKKLGAWTTGDLPRPADVLAKLGTTGGRKRSPLPPAEESGRKAAESVSAQLKEEMEKEEAPPRRRGDDWGSAQPEATEVPPKPWMQRTVERVFLADDEIAAVSERLREELSLGEKRSDYGSVIRALDRSEENQRLAHRFMVTCKRELMRWEVENEALLDAMRTEANKHLQAEKDKGERSKQITDADVTNKVANLFGDEWKDFQMHRRELDLTIKNAEHMVSVWSDRCRSLNTIASKLR